jgi:long-subunit acyl-CoA synthetase (AMP-forming)
VENCTESELHLAQENNIKIIATTPATQNGGNIGDVLHLEDVHSDDPAIILFTSGTTSVPKGVLHSHSNLLHAVESKRSTLESILEPNGSILGILPLFHALGFTSVFLFALYVSKILCYFNYSLKSSFLQIFWFALCIFRSTSHP